MREATACGHQKFKHVVEARGVALARGNQRQALLQIFADAVALEVWLTRLEAVQVSAERVDFAVMSEVAERMSQGPSRERVGRITLVDKRNCAFEIVILQVLVKAFDLSRKQKSLIDNRLGAARADVKILDGFFDQAAEHEELDFKRFVRFELGTVKNILADVRERFASRVTDCGRIYRNFTDLDNRGSFYGGELFNFCIGRISSDSVFDKDHCHAVTVRQVVVNLVEKLVRHRKQKAGAIARFRVATCRTAMEEAL